LSLDSIKPQGVCDPLLTEFVQPVEDPRLDPLQDHTIRALNVPIHAGLCHGGPVNADVVVIAEPEEFLSGIVCCCQ
jgi:hypothetical protein